MKKLGFLLAALSVLWGGIAFAAADELASRAVDLDDASVAGHDDRRRYRVDRSLPAKLRRIAD